MLFFTLLIVLGAPIVALAVNLTVLKSGKTVAIKSRAVPMSELYRKVISLLLVVLFCIARLFRENAIHNQLGLNADGALLSPGATVMALVARWIGMLTLAMAILCF